MILYVNGDSHSAAAEAIVPCGFANDDPTYTHLGRAPHPENLAVSYGQVLANNLGADLYCDAESASGNDRIIRTTRNYIKANSPDIIIIGWSTWERIEYLYNGVHYQLNAGGVGRDWPIEVREYYKQWVVNAIPSMFAEHWHNEIAKFHLELQEKNIPHLFFNSYSAFNYNFITQIEWQDSYINPYDHNSTYFYWLQNQGINTVNSKSYHFGPDAHEIWANHLTKIINESIITK
jgi:hypothetical protein